MANKTSQPEAPVAAIDQPTSSFERFLEENLKTLLIAGAVIFVGIMGYLLFNYFSLSAAAEEAEVVKAPAHLEGKFAQQYVRGAEIYGARLAAPLNALCVTSDAASVVVGAFSAAPRRGIRYRRKRPKRRFQSPW